MDPEFKKVGSSITKVPNLSVVVPFYNEEKNIAKLYEKIRDVCNSLGRAYEIVFVDDGSWDQTFEVLKHLHTQDARVRVIRFRRNYGQTAAMMAGFSYARGEVIVSMDGDLQNDPVDIPRLLEKLDEGYDIVCGWRINRKDKWLTRRLPSMIANRIIAKLTGVSIRDNGCSLKAYRASVIKNVSLYGEMHRFIPALSSMAGARIVEIGVSHHARSWGISKYGMGRIWRVILDIVVVKMVTGFASRPALWFAMLGSPFAIFGVATLIVALTYYKAGLTILFLISFLFLMLGGHFFSMGVIGELALKTGDYSPKRNLVKKLMI